jgi:hypothetical protein
MESEQRSAPQKKATKKVAEGERPSNDAPLMERAPEASAPQPADDLLQHMMLRDVVLRTLASKLVALLAALKFTEISCDKGHPSAVTGHLIVDDRTSWPFPNMP